MAQDVDNLTFNRVASSATSVTLAAGDNRRQEVIITNASTSELFVTFGPTASATNYTLKLAAGDTLFNDTWNGALSGYWTTANGFAHVTEVRG